MRSSSRFGKVISIWFILRIVAFWLMLDGARMNASMERVVCFDIIFFRTAHFTNPKKVVFFFVCVFMSCLIRWFFIPIWHELKIYAASLKKKKKEWLELRKKNVPTWLVVLFGVIFIKFIFSTNPRNRVNFHLWSQTLSHCFYFIVVIKLFKKIITFKCLSEIVTRLSFHQIFQRNAYVACFMRLKKGKKKILCHVKCRVPLYTICKPIHMTKQTATQPQLLSNTTRCKMHTLPLSLPCTSQFPLLVSSAPCAI